MQQARQMDNYNVNSKFIYSIKCVKPFTEHFQWPLCFSSSIYGFSKLSSIVQSISSIYSQNSLTELCTQHSTEMSSDSPLDNIMPFLVLILDLYFITYCWTYLVSQEFSSPLPYGTLFGHFCSISSFSLFFFSPPHWAYSLVFLSSL